MLDAYRRCLFATAAFALAAAHGPGAQAAGTHAGGHGHDAHGHGHGHAAGIGQPGNPSEASRTIVVTLTDNQFAPERIRVRKGETIRFLLRNRGEIVHEFNIGTAAMHARHQQEMAMMVEHGVITIDRINYERMKMDMGGGRTMEHDDPNSKLLEPGKSAELVWQFDTDTELEFACNVPGHYDAGMVGKITVGR